MDRVKKIEEEINLLEKQLLEAKGKETEVYTRIVGYYRAVKNWNKGKREEYNHRVCFTNLNADINARRKEQEVSKEETYIPVEDDLSSYSYFYRKTCPNCPSVKKYLDKLEMQGDSIDVDTPEGISIAREKGILSVPTVVFSNNLGIEVYRARNIKELTRSIPLSVACAV